MLGKFRTVWSFVSPGSTSAAAVKSWLIQVLQGSRAPPIWESGQTCGGTSGTLAKPAYTLTSTVSRTTRGQYVEGKALGSSVVLGLLIPMGSIYPIPIRGLGGGRYRSGIESGQDR